MKIEIFTLKGCSACESLKTKISDDYSLNELNIKFVNIGVKSNKNKADKLNIKSVPSFVVDIEKDIVFNSKKAVNFAQFKASVLALNARETHVDLE